MSAFARLALLGLLVLEACWFPPRARSAERPSAAAWTQRSTAVGKHGMAATNQPLATLAAVDVLRAGGHAVDAAIAANAVLAVTDPANCGLGGDLFAIVWEGPARQMHGLNGSGRSPQALAAEVFATQGLTSIPSQGFLPVTVPGCVDGWFALHRRFGRLPMATVLAPAIQCAREGFPVTEVIAREWAQLLRTRREQPGFTSVFAPGGSAPRHGQLFRNPELADTLERLAADGVDAFYRGEIARCIDRFMRDHGGYLRYEDLASHRSEWAAPTSVSYRGYDVWELPPNGQGLAALQMLRILEQFDLRRAGFGSPDHLHALIEAKKLAFADRARFYADPHFAPAPVAALLSADYARQRRALIRDDRALAAVEAGNPALGDGDTVYLAAADSDRNMVSLIQSNFHRFGAGVCPPGLGFCLQNRGQLFDLSPSRPNSYAPGKRPFHTIIPAFVTREGRPVMSFGVMGGDMQPQGHVQILLNLLDFDMGLQEAGDAPRVYHGGSAAPTGEPGDSAGGRVLVERGFAPETLEELTRRGHRIAPPGGAFGGYQAIWYDADEDVYRGATESRKDGMALGY